MSLASGSASSMAAISVLTGGDLREICEEEGVDFKLLMSFSSCSMLEFVMAIVFFISRTLSCSSHRLCSASPWAISAACAKKNSITGESRNLHVHVVWYHPLPP